MPRYSIILQSSLLIVLTLFGFNYTPASAQTIVCSTPTFITTDGTGPSDLGGFGDNHFVWVLWGGQDNGYMDKLYTYEFATGKVKLIGQFNFISSLSVDGNDVVWESGEFPDDKVYHQDLNTGITSMLLNNPSTFSVEVKDRVVAWEKWFQVENDYEIVIFDLNTHSTTRLSDNNWRDTLIGIDGNRVAYTSWETDEFHVYDLATQQTTSWHIPAIGSYSYRFFHGKYLAFDNWNTDAVQLIDISSNTLIHTVEDAHIAAFDGKTLLYNSYNRYSSDYYGLFAYDLATQSTLQLADGERSGTYFTLDGEHVVWLSDYYDGSDDRVFYYNLRLKSFVEAVDMGRDGGTDIGVMWHEPYLFWSESFLDPYQADLLFATCGEPTSTPFPTDTPIPAAETPTSIPPTATTVIESTATQVPSTAETTATDQPTNPPSTPTAESALDLVTNGGFENGQNGWTVKRGVGDKVKCNKDGKPPVAKSETCAFEFKGGAGERSSVEQTLAMQTWKMGESLNLSVFVKATNASAKGKIKVRVNYTDGTPTGKIDADIKPNSDYTELTGSYTLLSANVSRVKVSIQNRSAAGKVLVDDVVLAKSGAAGLIGLP